MDLKSTIDNTNKFKDDLKLAKEKINDKILSGGGTIANTLNGVPDAIDGMLGNYNKIAIWEGSDYHSPSYNQITKIKKKINCNFEIKRFIVFIIGKGWTHLKAAGADSKDFVNFAYSTYIPEMKLSIQNGNEIVIEVKNESSVIEFYIKKIIAIG